MANQTYALASNGVYGQSSGVYVDSLVTVPNPVYQYNAQKAFGTNAEGSTTTSWPDSVGSADLSGGSPTVVGSGVNGYRAVDYDGTNDELGTNFSTTITQPYTIISVVDSPGTSDEGRVYGVNDSNDPRVILWYSGSNNEWRANTTSNVVGSFDATSQLITVVWDGSNSFIREDGTQTGSGDVGTNDLKSINLGSGYASSGWYSGLIGLVEVYDKKLSSSEITNREQTIANNWGITI